MDFIIDGLENEKEKFIVRINNGKCSVIIRWPKGSKIVKLPPDRALSFFRKVVRVLKESVPVEYCDDCGLPISLHTRDFGRCPRQDEL